MNDPSAPDRERLVAFLDGELPEGEAREVAAWLASNPEAAREAEEHRRVWRVLGAYADEPVPPGFSRRVLETVGSDDARERPRASLAPLSGGRVVRRVAIAASIVAAVGLGAFLGRRTAPPRAAEAPTPVVAIETLPAEVLTDADLETLASLSDEDFEILLAGNPDELAAVTRGG